MDKNRKKLLISIILVVLYFVLLGSLNQLFTGDKSNDLINMVTILLSFVCIIYEFILIFNKNIDLNKHKKGIMWSSILFFIINIVSGILGFIVNGNLDNPKKNEKRALPQIELKEYTNKYICLVAFIICLLIILFAGDYIKNFWQMLGMYALIFILMISVYFKQLKHDFKIFKEYFREYSSLVFKTWGKALVVTMIVSLILQIVTGVEKANNQINLQESFKTMPVFIALLSTLYAPIAEELMFRGTIRKFIKNKKAFILVSGILFGLLHVIDDSKTLAEFSYVIVYSVLGMYLSTLYVKTNNLCANIFMHFLQNTLSVIGMLLLTFM